MRIERNIALGSIVLLFFAAYGQDTTPSFGTQRSKQPAELWERSGSKGWNAFEFDITQHTCALYVAVRSAAFESPLEFGREVEDSMVHWNMCPGGTMVACVATPTAKGDTVITGIPWPH